jgi:dTDP-glucose 4,6-dehydratase
MDKSKPILILGSNSFSGSSYVNKLLSEEFNVIGIGRSEEINSAYCPYKSNTNLHNFTFKQIDLNVGFKAIAELVSQNKIEYIFNFASQSMVAQSWHLPEHWYQTNVIGLSKLCNLLLKEKSIKRFVHFTTPEVYGSTIGWLKESFNFAPSTPYAVSRAAGDWHLKCLFENFGFPVIFTRAANVYGPGQPLYRIIPKTILSAFTGQKVPLDGGGKSIRSFIHMNDVSSALTEIMTKGKIGDSYHISTNEMISVYELIKEIALKLDVELEDLIIGIIRMEDNNC